MQEVIKRINAGWVLMDSMNAQDKQIFFLERGEKAKCQIELNSDGHGWLYTSTRTVRI